MRRVGLAWDDDSLRAQFGAIAEHVRPGVLGGSDEEVLDAIGRYIAAGADRPVDNRPDADRSGRPPRATRRGAGG